MSTPNFAGARQTPVPLHPVSSPAARRKPWRRALPWLTAVLVVACKGTSPAPAAKQEPATASKQEPAATALAAPDAGPATAAPAHGEDGALGREALTGIVTRYRQNIVLAADEATLDAETRERVAIVGRMLFEENRHALESLGEGLHAALTAASGSPTAPTSVTTFLDWLEKDAELHDADKLAFRDTLADLRDALTSLEPAPAWKASLRARAEEDQRALQAIQALYEKELQAVFGRFDTRGMPVRREAWEAYLAFLKGRFTRESILQSFDDTLRPLGEGLRGKGPRKEDPAIITGNTLPPKTLVLTFDDGPHPRHTPSILATLEKFGVKSIFFEVGQNVALPAKGTADAGTALHRTEAGAYSERILQAGHLLANHSLTHAFLPKLSDERLTKEIDESKRIIESVTNSRISLFRPPYGARNEKVSAALAARQLKAYLWNVDSLDWSDPLPTSIANRVVQQVEANGRGVILLHDVHAQTAEALPLILETLQTRGYRFVLWDGATVLGGDADGGTPAAPAPAALYRESHAVVIGINAYQKWPKLSYAVNDAQGVRDLLVRKYRFKPENVTVLLDEQATRERILSVLGDSLADPSKVQREDRVFVFFAGHGITRRLPNGKSLGYIVPVDADTSNYQSTAISMTNFQDISEAMAAKHVFFVMDACYSGLALTRGGAPAGADVRKYLQEVTRRSVRQVLTAGGADEQVADQGPNGHSIFTWTLLQGLEGQADLNTDGYVTASELAAYVGPTVSSLSRQTPAFGSMPGSEGGEFVLELNHEGEFLSESSEQLDTEAIRLNAELERVRREIAEKTARNEALARELAEAKNQLSRLQDAGTVAAAAPVPPATPAEQARRHGDRGMTLYREKRYAEALAEFQAAARLDPTDAQATNNVGFVHFRRGEYAEAVKWLEKTLALDPQRAVAYLNLGDAYDKLGRGPDAAKAYGRYLALLPDGPAAGAVKEKLARLGR
ncbi:polysaccharide deacetylase family protein [Myxococcus sp. RHSTA-1-4]|uniref:polysaccharide deacetylase family protein n=1 Tax=Myxococcus sp. RHSTA-1-4 TaxID=2874601 RepID=UPI001CBE7C63|nr:polysaccharide deacetylase family protein [Myxococcus sp. RHSTA-1-4]MBZ4418386.1 polysaccharide deacetylase family protein [Myxococcus sp. RHSTA-1-4]